MFPLILLLGGALALVSVLPSLPPTFNVELTPGTLLLTPAVMDDFLLYLPASPAVEGTAAVVGDIVDNTAAVVGDIVNTVRNSAAQVSPEFIWLSDMSLSDIGYGPAYIDFNLVFVDTLGGMDMANGTGDLLVMDLPVVTAFEDNADQHNGSHNVGEDEPVTAIPPLNVDDEVRDIVTSNSTDKAIVDVAATDDIDDGCDGGTDCPHEVTEYEIMLFILLVAVWIWAVPGILSYSLPPIVSLLSRLPIIRILVDDLRQEFAYGWFSPLFLAYRFAGVYFLEEILLGPLFADPFKRIKRLMEYGRIDTMFMAQEFLILYWWAWWELVVPMERAAAQVQMGVVDVDVVEEWVMHETDGGAHRRSSETGGLSGPWALKVLSSFHKVPEKLLFNDHGIARRFVRPETTELFGDLD